MNRLDGNEILTAQIRALQSMYAQAHAALLNWGHWSNDRKAIGPPPPKPSPIFDQYRSGDYEDADTIAESTEAPVKAERAEQEPYDEKSGTILDERIHGPGGLSLEVRRALRVAYCTRETPEYQWPTFAGCGEDAFRERLEAGLLFVGRFV